MARPRTLRAPSAAHLFERSPEVPSNRVTKHDPNGLLDCKAGDTVCYAAKFLRSTGQVTGHAGSRRGKVLEVCDLGTPREGEPPQFARVDWQDGHEPVLVHRRNLAHPGANRRACAC